MANSNKTKTEEMQTLTGQGGAELESTERYMLQIAQADNGMRNERQSSGVLGAKL